MNSIKQAAVAAGSFVVAALVVAGTAQAGPTMEKVKKDGVVTCGISTGLAGFSLADAQGKYTGLDVDFCRQLAAVALGDANKVKFVPLSAQLNFAPTTFYDGQGFMVFKKLGVKSAKELNGATVCVQPGTTTELNLADFFRANKMTFKPVVIEKLDEVENAYFSGRCDVYTTDRSGLAATRISKAPNPDDQVILPEVISKEPLAPAVRHGDDEWFDIVKWTQFAALETEEKGITSKNVDQMLKSEDPDIKRLLGVTPGMGKSLGVDEKWVYNMVKQVGNYGEIFDRNVGKDSPMKLERGLNDLWTRGGLMYSPPIR